MAAAIFAAISAVSFALLGVAARARAPCSSASRWRLARSLSPVRRASARASRARGWSPRGTWTPRRPRRWTFDVARLRGERPVTRRVAARIAARRHRVVRWTSATPGRARNGRERRSARGDARGAAVRRVVGAERARIFRRTRRRPSARAPRKRLFVGATTKRLGRGGGGREAPRPPRRGPALPTRGPARRRPARVLHACWCTPPPLACTSTAWTSDKSLPHPTCRAP